MPKTNIEIAPLSTEYMNIMKLVLEGKPDDMDEIQYLAHVQTVIAVYFWHSDNAEAYASMTTEVWNALDRIFKKKE